MNGQCSLASSIRLPVQILRSVPRPRPISPYFTLSYKHDVKLLIFGGLFCRRHCNMWASHVDKSSWSKTLYSFISATWPNRGMQKLYERIAGWWKTEDRGVVMNEAPRTIVSPAWRVRWKWRTGKLRINISRTSRGGKCETIYHLLYLVDQSQYCIFRPFFPFWSAFFQSYSFGQYCALGLPV